VRLVFAAALALVLACGGSPAGQSMNKEIPMTERAGAVVFGGKPATLLGRELKVGDAAPDFTAVGNDLRPVALSQFKGRAVVIASVPSLDTPTCDLETRRFNAEAVKLGTDVVILTVSMDLPFAQKRWCGAAGVDRVITVSDHRDASFGTAYGVLIKDVRLLARAVFVVDRQGVIRYVQLVKETGKEPDYAPVLQAVKELQ
jgi:thioredoxin-dependent peroxiredoxin